MAHVGGVPCCENLRKDMIAVVSGAYTTGFPADMGRVRVAVYHTLKERVKEREKDFS